MVELLPVEMIALTAGLVCGFLSSSPLGSINLWIISQVLDERKAATRMAWFLIGVVSADLTYAALAAWGYHTIFADTAAEKWIAGIGGAFLIILGLLALRPRKEEITGEGPPAGSSPLRQWLLGAFMCGSNPGFLLFWIFAIDQLENNLSMVFSGRALYIFLAGIAAGDLLWFTLLIGGVRRFRRMVSEKVTAYLNRGVAAAFMIIGAIGIIKIV